MPEQMASDGAATLGSTTPILRIFDIAKATEFYVHYLGFSVDWEHRFEEGLPLYMQVSRGACRIHLSEHHGDACPGSSLRIETENVTGFHAELSSKNYRFARPGIETTPWNTLEVRVSDPFGNKLIFYEEVNSSKS